MKKKTIGLIGLASITLFSLVGTALNTISWFVASVTNKEYKLNGSSAGAYFAYGDGSSTSPYGISIPRHLYNLAWLQYLGQFSDKQYYFELADSLTTGELDMSGYTLPPIGTESKPFVGNFNGNGKVITGLTVTNDQSEIFSSDKHPDQTQVQYTTPQIVGLFGVVGNLNSAYTGTYDSAVNTIYNLGIKDITVKSSTSNTLVGIAAGYVDGVLSNVAVNDSSLYTAVNASAITSITDCVSNYSLVGYCTPSRLGEMKLRSDDADIPTVENPNTVSGGDNWGGSINMQDMYTYLRTLSNSAEAYSYVTAETVRNYADGTSITTTTATDTNNAYSSDWSEYYRYEGSKVVEDGNEYASITFARSSGNYNWSSYNDNDTKYICLYGGKNIRGTYVSGYNNRTNNNATKTTTTITETAHSGSGNNVITDGDGNFLRCTDASTFSNVTTPTTGCYFTLNNNGNLYVTYNNNTYYLYYNNSTTLASARNPSNTNLNSNAYKWVYDSTNKRLSVNNGSHYLYLNNTTWALISSTTVSKQGYTFSYNGNYMNASGTSLVMSSGNNTTWYMDGSNVYTTIDGSNYYVCYSGSNVILSTNGSKLTYETTYNKFYYTQRSGMRTYYYPAQVSGTSLTMVTNSTARNANSMGGTAFTRTAGPTIYTYTLYTTLYTDNYVTTTTTSNDTNATYDSYPTYFPLTRDKDEETGEYTGSGKPDEKNTGYIISGCNLTDSTQGIYGDIRVSRFNISDISVGLSGSSTFSASKLEVVTRTCVRNDAGTAYTDSGWTRISDDYNSSNSINNTLSTTFTSKKNYKTELRLSKYKTSRSQLNTTLSSGSGYIYGLHFMDAAISKTNIVTAPNVIVLDGKTLDPETGKAIGSEYTNYPLPQDSIDFNLKDQGFINFFAGTYFKSSNKWNDTFFSLHKITRDSNNVITDISQIKKIYAPASGTPSADNPYVYAYTDAVPGNAGDLVFDTSWITAPTMVNNAVYYFEIPVNAGEYALGSVSGKNGAYLMYLDIGAGAANYRDIVTTEHVETISKNTSYPLGIEFHSITANTVWANLNGGETCCVKINSNTNAQQTLLFEYDSSVLVVTTTGNDPPIMAEYQQEGISISKKVGETSSALTFSPPVSYTIVRDAVTLESFNTFTSSVTKELNETYTITGAKNGDKIQLSLPITTTGFTADGSAVFTVSSGSAEVNSSGLITVTGAGEIVVTVAYSESKANVETWDSATTIVADDTEGTIFAFHLRDYNTPNLVTRYVYDGVTNTYTVYITATVDGEIEIDTLPPEGYTVKVVINNGTPITLTSESTTTSITIDV